MQPRPAGTPARADMTAAPSCQGHASHCKATNLCGREPNSRAQGWAALPGRQTSPLRPSVCERRRSRPAGAALALLYVVGAPLSTASMPVRLPISLPPLPRISSRASGFFFWGMRLDPAGAAVPGRGQPGVGRPAASGRFHTGSPWAWWGTLAARGARLAWADGEGLGRRLTAGPKHAQMPSPVCAAHQAPDPAAAGPPRPARTAHGRPTTAGTDLSRMRRCTAQT